MTAIIEDTSAPLPADAWRHAPDLTRHTTPKRDELAALTEQFLAQGGTITQVTTGATGVTNPLEIYSKPAPRTVQMDARDKADVDRLLGLAGQGRWDIARAMGVSDDRVQRLLRLYLADDKRFDAARAVDAAKQQADRDKERVSLIKAALVDGVVGLAEIGRRCDIPPSTVGRLGKRYGLNIPRAMQNGHNPCT